jgi:hypothetical protein
MIALHVEDSVLSSCLLLLLVYTAVEGEKTHSWQRLSHLFML